MHEASLPEDSVCDCGGTALGTNGRGWLCVECIQSCQVSGRLSISDPEPFDIRDTDKVFRNQPVDFASLEARGWPGPYSDLNSDSLAYLDTLKLELLGPFSPSSADPLPDNG